MEIVKDNGILKIFDSDNNLLYTPQDSADGDQFILSYIPVESKNIDSDYDFIEA